MYNFHSDEEILLEVERHHREAKLHRPDLQILGTFYYGSGNYGLDSQTSDTDTKVIVIPSIKEFYLNKTPISSAYELDNSEHINYMDIRLYFNQFKKQNINFLEILFTKYNQLNISYLSEWEQLVQRREDIAHYNPRGCIKTIYGNMLNARKRIDSDPLHCGKHLSNVIRYDEFISRYVNGISFENCLISEYLTELKELRKNSDGHTPQSAGDVAEEHIQHSKKIVDEYWCDNSRLAAEIDEFLEQIQTSIIEQSVRRELQC
jgi:predicted nucleotidyltransferase